MNISTKQKQTHRHRKQTCGCQGGGGWGRMDWEFGVSRLDSIRYGMNKQEGLLYSTGNYIQYPVIMEKNMKEYEKECIYMYN